MSEQTQAGNASRTVTDWLQNDDEIKELIELLLDRFPDAKGIFLVGGALRDQLLNPPRPLKDVDVVFDGIPLERLQEIEGTKPNFFAGMTLEFQGLSVDMWGLQDTYHIRKFHEPSTIAAFMKGAPFNLDKIAYDLRSETLYDEGCLAGIETRQIVYAPANAYLESIQALRCVLLRWKTGFALHASADDLLHRVAHRLSEDDSPLPEMRRYLHLLKRFYDDTVFDRAINEILERS